MALIGPSRSRREWLANTLLFSVLVIAVLVLVNRLGREHLRGVVDLSEERLAEPSAIGAEMLGELEDVLDVRAYFTGKMKIGPAQIAKRRLVDALERWEDLADGKLRLSFSDPNESTEERVEAQALGVVSVPLPGLQGTTEVTQEVFLGLRLRLAGREAVVPWVLPQTLEQAFFSELFWLRREHRPVLGLVGAQGEEFAALRNSFGDRYAVRELVNLAHAEPVPADVDVLVAVAPEFLHPRAVYEVEQFAQRGGRLLLLVDPFVVDVAGERAATLRTGFEDVLEAWGIGLSPTLVWDARRSNRITLRRIVESGGVQREEVVPLEYPPWPNVGVEGLSTDSPITASVAGASLFWAAALGDGREALAGVRREDLLTTSEYGYLVPLANALQREASTLSRTNLELAAGGAGRRIPLAVTLEGKLPSPFGSDVPAPVDVVGEVHFRDALATARTTLGPWPERSLGTVPADPLSAEHATAVVVIGDSDLVRGRFLEANPVNAQLVRNAVDWLALSPELLGLRARRPRARALADFVAEEREARGLGALVGGLDPDEARRVSALEEAAQDAAAARRARRLGAALAGALALALGAGCLARWLLARGLPKGGAVR